jgi:enoyl-[acyl-carrier-protein] reductase (NADH)
MSITSFFSRHPLASFLALSLLICGSAEVAGTQTQWVANDQVAASPSNPHRIPDQMDPKSIGLSEEIKLIKVEVREEVAEMDETIHSVAFQDHHGLSQPILDYTTGTSN